MSNWPVRTNVINIFLILSLYQVVTSSFLYQVVTKTSPDPILTKTRPDPILTPDLLRVERDQPF
jgi:hypothetical protein